MLRRYRLLTLLIGLFVIASPASALVDDDDVCPHACPAQPQCVSKCEYPAQTQCVTTCEAPVQLQKAADDNHACPQACPAQDKCTTCETPIQRLKPSAYEPARDIVTRNLPVVYHKEAERALRAAEVVEEFPNKGLMNEARAIAVIPSVKKAAFIFGARWGKGLLTVRDDNGCWLPPSYIQITGGNFGFQAGVEAVDLVLIFTNRDAVNALLNGKMTINGDASAAAGPVGGTAQAGVPLLVNSGIVTFVSKSKGLFAGISLDGAAITINDTANERVYGKWINGDEILLGKRVEPNEVVAPFLNALATHAPGHTLVPVQGVAGSPTTVATPTKPTN